MPAKSTKELRPKEFYAKFKKKQKRPKATIVAAVLLLLFMTGVFFVMPPTLPWAMQKLVGLVNAVLVALVGLFAVREFGEKFSHPAYPPVRKKLDLGKILAAVLFVMTGAWWLSGLAPIAVDQGGPEEIARLLNEEVALAVLVMPDTTLAVMEPPLPPPRAAELAALIPNDADDYARLIKLIAQRKYIEAGGLAENAAGAQADPAKWALATGQLKVFSGDVPEAIEFFEKASAVGADASAMAQTAVVYALAGNLQKAYVVASQLVDRARGGQFKDPQALGIGLNVKTAVALSSGRFPEALALAEESQLTWEALPDSVFKAASRNNQAVVYAMLPRKYPGAATQFDGALTLWRDFYGTDSVHVASNQASLGVLAMSQARYSEASRRLNEARAMFTRQVRAVSPVQFSAANALARLNIKLARFDTAESLIQSARDCIRKAPLLDAAVLGTEGSLLAEQGKYSDASSQFSKAIVNCQSLVTAEHLFLADLRIRQAVVTSLRGRFGETKRSCQEVIKVVDEQLSSSHPVIARAYNALGWEYVRGDKRSEARKQFEAAQQIFEANKLEITVSPDAANTMAGLSQTHSRREWRDGINDLRTAIELDLKVFGRVLGLPVDAQMVNLPSTAQYLYEQAMLLMQFGSSTDLEAATQLFEEAMHMQEALLPPAHPALAATYENYGKLLARLGRDEQAKEMEAKAERTRELLQKLE